MKTEFGRSRVSLITLLLGGAAILLAQMAQAHCDTEGGPLIREIRGALEKGNVTPILKWVRAQDKAEIRGAFAKTLAVRKKGADAQELADQYFVETVVRIHRAGEGAPFTGIKDEPVEPIVALADKALADGSADAMIAELNAHLAAAVREKFAHAMEASKSKEKSVEAGREFVEAYVDYMHFVEGIHTAFESVPEYEHQAETHPAAPAKSAEKSSPSAPKKSEHRER